MRSLVVASQKGGVGKTTTVLNLAAVASQQGRVVIVDTDPISSVAASLGLEPEPAQPGTPRLTPDVLPGVDLMVWAPDDSGSAAELRARLAELGAEHALALIDVQPWVGPESDEIYSTADELVTVLRADPLSFRTLPGFLRTITRLRDERELEFRGVVLTLPAGEAPGGDWERSLRGRFGDAILPSSIPWDDAVSEALMARRPVVLAAPESAAAERYRALAGDLGLSP